ncbi:MAG: cell division protein ZapB [Proteobacteria bacterium]|nr:cell division protein ZapB [Pseudomonadota bacterium]
MKPLHIFRAGLQTPLAGEPILFSEADIIGCVEAYDPAAHEAPIVVGHPKINAPAYGWVKSLTAAGGDLIAEPHQVDPAFAELVAAGRYKKISASFYAPDSPANPKPGSYYLRHVGFLGAQPPAVKGLREPQFADGEEGVVEIEFNEPEIAPEPNVPTSAHLTEPETTVTPEELAALQAENAQLKQQNQVLQEERQREAAERRHAGNASFAEGLIAQGRLAPKDRPLVESLLDALGSTPVEFGEGEQKQDIGAAFKAFLSSRDPIVSFGEHATKNKATGGVSDASIREFAEKNVDPDRLALHARARALASEKHIPYGEAIRQAIAAAQ